MTSLRHEVTEWLPAGSSSRVLPIPVTSLTPHGSGRLTLEVTQETQMPAARGAGSGLAS